MKKFIYLISIAIFAISCESVQGPIGPKGDQGLAGEDGDAGEDGSSNITTVIIEISYDEAQKEGNIYGNQIAMPQITKAVYDSGSVDVFIDIGGAWFAMPFRLSFELTYGYSEGNLYIFHISTTSLFKSDFITGPYKVVITYPTGRQKRATSKQKDNLLIFTE